MNRYYSVNRAEGILDTLEIHKADSALSAAISYCESAPCAFASGVKIVVSLEKCTWTYELSADRYLKTGQYAYELIEN